MLNLQLDAQKTFAVLPFIRSTIEFQHHDSTVLYNVCTLLLHSGLIDPPLALLVMHESCYRDGASFDGMEDKQSCGIGMRVTSFLLAARMSMNCCRTVDAARYCIEAAKVIAKLTESSEDQAEVEYFKAELSSLTMVHRLNSMIILWNVTVSTECAASASHWQLSHEQVCLRSRAFRLMLTTDSHLPQNTDVIDLVAGCSFSAIYLLTVPATSTTAPLPPPLPRYLLTPQQLLMFQ
jgi:hypothetical protein